VGSHPLLVSDAAEPALVEAASGLVVSYRELVEAVDARREVLDYLHGHVVFLGMEPSVASVVDYLALTRVGCVVALLDPATSTGVVGEWMEAYRPRAVLGLRDVPDVMDRGVDGALPFEPGWDRDSVLLPTSGSTGSSKFVRLSMGNVVSNAQQIAEALGITSDDRAFAHLGLYYSYGLSVLNSHLLSGAVTILSGDSAMQPSFWRSLEEYQATSMPGVPYSYELFDRVGFADLRLPALRDLTQAGGRLNPERIVRFGRLMVERGGRFWVMYGQTEATARISVLPASELPAFAGTVGFPLRGMRARVVDGDASGLGELVVEGPNVMLGYASAFSDIDGVDVQKGVLRTGDLARVDEDGRLSIGGRLKRIAKVFGVRVNLDDVEKALVASFGSLAVIACNDRVVVFLEGVEGAPSLSREMERRLRFPAHVLEVRSVPNLPLNASSKIDYEELRSLCKH